MLAQPGLTPGDAERDVGRGSRLRRPQRLGACYEDVCGSVPDMSLEHTQRLVDDVQELIRRLP